MKKYSYLYIIFSLFSSITAEELPKPHIKSLIEQVKRAKVKDRRLLMNQLKLQLRKMNKESRHSAMVELKKSFSKEHNGKKLHRQQKKSKSSHERQCIHQPRYRHLRHQRGQGNGHQGQRGGNGNGHK